MRLLRRSCRACASGIGGPTSRRFSRVTRIDPISMLRRQVADERASPGFLRNFYVAGRSLDAGLSPRGVRVRDRSLHGMCHPSESAATTRRAVGPRWIVLYGVTLPQLVALAAVEASTPAPPVRALLRWTLALGTFVAMALWVRANRAAFDQEDWCDCAGRSMTVRGIASRRPLAPRPSEERVVERERERVLGA